MVTSRKRSDAQDELLSVRWLVILACSAALAGVSYTWTDDAGTSVLIGLTTLWTLHVVTGTVPYRSRR